jgi:3-deoxy-D-manno-octulosonic-acid transferase
VYYLPFDSAENAKKWLDYLQPTIIFFVKYEFWHYYLQEAKTRNIITISFSAIFRQNQLFFSPYAKLYPQVLQCFSHIFVQNENSLQLLQQIGISSASIAGDTRLDRVLEIAKQAKKFPIVDNFTQNSFVCVLGSTWEDDIAVLAPFFTTFSQKIKIIIAPHEISENKLKNIEKAFYIKKTSRYSQSNVETVANFDILLVDTIGMLSSLYAYGNIAFVGGGYGDGLHNILEPAVFGLPIFFGNKKYKKFQEAIDLLDLGAAFAVGSAKEMEDKFLQLYTNAIDRDNISKILATYMQKNKGGTEKIINFLANNYSLCEY